MKYIQRTIKADIWYINTISVPPAILAVGNMLGVKIITHFHELPHAYRLVSKTQLQTIINYSDVCIGCSKIVCDRILELGHNNVQLFYSFIDTKIIEHQLSQPKVTRASWGISDDAFVWVISGTVMYEKGLDYLPKILDLLHEENVQIIWLGNQVENGFFHYIFTILKKRWPGKIYFFGTLRTDYYQVMSLADGLLMPSHEDSFSLVMLEAAYLGLPIVSFNSGGVKEFVDTEKGIVVDSWNAADLVEAMRIVMNNTVPNKPRSRPANFKFDMANQVSHFNQLMQKIVSDW